MGSSPVTVLWFRRDLRLSDHGALATAARSGAVLPLFVLDPRLLEAARGPRAGWILASVSALAADLRQYDATLVIRSGDPATVVPAVAAEVGAASVHVTADFGPYGRARDLRVADALTAAARRWIESDTPYAVAPGQIRTGAGDAFKVFGPFYRAWQAHGWPGPAPSDPATVTWLSAPSDDIPQANPAITLPSAGEQAALAAWERFRDRLPDYAAQRDRPDLDATSRLSPYLKAGAIHPRTLLDGLGITQLASAAPLDDTFRRQLAWREFYAAVLSRWPTSATEYFNPQLARLPWASGEELNESLTAWQHGRTGYPIVDAGMRQLLAEGWMHNRLRMIVASFLVKDLRVEWTHGARHFMRHLIDGDLANNQHGWQWVAGCGTDAAPYFRIFNPVTQSKKFDPAGSYIRRWVPELGALPDRYLHEPWTAPDGPPSPYPRPIVDHAEARAAALSDYEALRRQ